MDELLTTTIADLSGLIEQREVSPVALVEAQLARIAALDGRIGSYLLVSADLAREQAHAVHVALLVVGEREMHRRAQAGRLETRDGVDAAGDEALHVGAAAAQPAVVTGGEREGVAGPVLTGHRHHVGMAREHHPGHVVGAGRGVEVGLAGFVAGLDDRPDAVVVQTVGDPVDEGLVAAAADRVEGDQGAQDVQGAVQGHGAASLRVGIGAV